MGDPLPDQWARAANAANNAMYQQLRLQRWRSSRDALWRLVRPYVRPGVSVAIVGGGSADDIPLRRLLEREAKVTIIDFDPDATRQASRRALPHEITVHHADVTGGAADHILHAVQHDTPLPASLDLPCGPLLEEPADLVIGDMLYTQLLHAGLLALGVTGPRQHELMQRYDRPLAHALVERIHATVRPTGHALHLHDVACWTRQHPQPVSLRRAMRRPETAWQHLRRHDACDPHLILADMGLSPIEVCWWRWPFEPNKQFLVRASLVRISD